MVPRNRFLDEVPAALGCFPGLALVEKQGVAILSGFIDLVAEDGEFQDRYEVEIHPSNNYPNSFPLVYETGGRIPWNIDWHVYPDGHFCLAVPAEERLACMAGIQLHSFIQKQVLGFLFNQTFRRRNGYFYQERSHGISGRLEYYREFLGIRNDKKLIRFLGTIADGCELGSHTKCICGSGKKFKKCHRRAWRMLGRKAGDIVKQEYQTIQLLLDSKS